MAPEKSPDHVALGAAIREFRAEKNISQERLGQISGLHRNYIGGIERGDLNPSYTSLLKLATALGIRPSELIAAAESIPPLAR
jgi:transcriptional regulator with XRE-family HTH domain